MASLAHEVRTPLTSVIGLLDLLKTQAPDQNSRETARTAAQSADYLLGLINDLMDLSRMEGGSLTMHRRPLEVCSALVQLVEGFRPLAERRGLSLILEMPEGPIWVEADRLRFAQVVGNYITNAIKFTRRGEIRVQLEVENREDGTAKFTTRVTDTGIGIPKALQPVIFDRFVQANGEGEKDRHGAGLGLSIVAEIARLSQGTCGVESVEGKGSTFWYSVSLNLTDPVASNTSDQNHNPATPKHILVADDNPATRRILEHMLTAMGHTLETVSHGEAAVDRLIDVSTKFDLAIIDMRMPGLEGQRVIEAVRLSDGPSASIPLIAMSADHDDEDVSRVMEAGATAFLPKPFDPAHLARLISGAHAVEAFATPNIREVG